MFARISLASVSLARAATILAVTLAVAGCTGHPDNIAPVTGFDKDRYLGRWYEIARLDHSFERGLSRVSADYSPRDDGGIRVINRGYSVDEARWEEAEGKAYFVGDADVGHLKVSFFGPFYGAYVIFDLDDNYQTSYVGSHNMDYLWLLSRRPTISDEERNRFIEVAREKGYDVDSLIWLDYSWLCDEQPGLC